MPLKPASTPFRLVLLSFCLTGLVACGSARKQDAGPTRSEDPQSRMSERPEAVSTVFNPQDYPIDYQGLRNYLRLQRRKTDLGFSAQGFDSCKVGYGLPRNKHCQTMQLSVINFRLQCRDSEGTTSTVQSNYNTTAISNTTIDWTLGRMRGESETDLEGYGQILAITPQPAQRERVKLSNGSDFLYMRAGDLSRVVTPASWCR